MTRRAAGVALLGIQLALVLSVAGKFFYERGVRPRVWVRAGSSDPNLPLRGRYLALPLVVEACGLPRDKAHYHEGYEIFGHVKMPVLNERPREPSNADYLLLREKIPCDRATLTHGSGGFTEVNYFIPDTARPPLPLKPGEELWVEVTVPAEGPPRPIQLALSDAGGFRVLKFE
jgi:hypothetical protein